LTLENNVGTGERMRESVPERSWRRKWQEGEEKEPLRPKRVRVMQGRNVVNRDKTKLKTKKVEKERVENSSPND